MKTCFKCQQAKRLEEFYRHPQMADGHLGKCKECTRSDVAAWKNKNYEHVTQYVHRRGISRRKNHLGGARLVRLLLSPEEQQRRAQAARLVNYAIERGELRRALSCEQCGTHDPRGARGQSLIQGHHDDYSQPLAVRWLCVQCHFGADIKAGTRLAAVGVP